MYEWIIVFESGAKPKVTSDTIVNALRNIKNSAENIIAVYRSDQHDEVEHKKFCKEMSQFYAQ